MKKTAKLVTKEEEAQIMELLDQGASYKEIAELTDRHPASIGGIINRIKKADVKPGYFNVHEEVNWLLQLFLFTLQIF